MTADLRCQEHAHNWVGCLANNEGIFWQVSHDDRRLAERRLLDEAVGYVPVSRIPRPGEMRELQIYELGQVRGSFYAVWLERHCLL